MKKRIPKIKGFHAHIYYDRKTRVIAARVRKGLDVLVHPETDDSVASHLRKSYSTCIDGLTAMN